MCGSVVMPNDSFSALWLMIIMTICGNLATTLTSPFLSHPFCPWNRQANKNPAADSISRGVRQTWLAAGMCLYRSQQDSQSIRESRFPRSLAHACGSHRFSTSCNRENSLLWTKLNDCKLRRMQSLAVITSAFLLVHVAGAEGPGFVLWCWGRQEQ